MLQRAVSCCLMAIALGAVAGPMRAEAFPLTTVAPGHWMDALTLPDGDFLMAQYVTALTYSPVIERVGADGTTTRVAGDPTQPNDSGGDGGPALDATFTSVGGLDVGADGSIWITDVQHVRKIGSDGIVHTAFYDANLPLFAHVVSNGSVYVVDAFNTFIIGTDGIVRQAHQNGFPFRPTEVDQFDVQDDGTLLAADELDNRIWRIDSNGAVSVAAGSTAGYSGDGGPPLLARFNHPYGLARVSPTAYVVGDGINGVIRLIEDGTVSTIATGITQPRGIHAGVRGLVIAAESGVYLLHKTQFLTGPRAFVDSSSATFTFSSYYDGPGFQCKVDRGSWATCTSPYTATNLEDGPHDFEVRAIDGTGPDPDPATSHFVVDTTGPNTVLTAQPPRATQDVDASFSFDSPQSGATFTCQLDGGDWIPCTSPQSYQALTNGRHVFDAKATTVDGHSDPTPVEAAWSVDTVAPTTTLTVKPAAHVAGRTARIEFASADGGTSFVCRLDGEPFAACSSPVTKNGLADGDHTFEIRAIDDAGNTESPATHWTWTTDPTPPDTLLSSTPAAATQETTAVFDLASDEPGVSYRCAFDDVALHACASAASAVHLGEGPHVFYAAATDAAGNIDPTPAEYHWIVDQTPPVAPVQGAPPAGATGVTPTTSLRFTAGSDAGAGLVTDVVTLDGHDLAPVPASACAAAAACVVQPPAALADGPHRWSVTARDAAGNATTSPPSMFTVDATPPAGLALLEPADAARVGTATPALRWASATDPGSGVDHYEVAIDSEPPVGTADVMWSPSPALPDGVHTWTVVAVDHAGNRTGAATRSFRVDTTAPTAALKVSPTQFVVPYEVTLDASGSRDADGGIVRYAFDLDGDGNFETISTTPRVTTLISAGGVHVLGVRVEDEVGLAAATTAQATGQGDVTTTGDKAAYVTIEHGASWTSKRDVALDINPPPHGGATSMVISNDGKPDETRKLSIAKHIDHWGLTKLSGRRDRRTVYVTFYNSAGFEVTNGRVQDDILYDPYAPVVGSAVLQVLGARDEQLAVTAHDRGSSGLKTIQLRSGKRTLLRAVPYARRRHLRIAKLPKHLQIVVRDRAGNATSKAVRIRR